MTGRRLSEDERALWSGVTRSIEPLRKRRKPAEDPPATDRVETPRQPQRPRPAAPAAPATLRPSPAPSPLPRRLRQRLARGREPLEDRIDLHGLTQVQAHQALLQFLRRAQARGARNVLVITGKGDAAGERGILRRQVPMWLRTADFSGFVAGFDDAGIRHGGAGALYVRLRRLRET